MIVKKIQPGKFPVTNKKAMNNEKIIPKLTEAFSTSVTGRHRRGKLNFLIRLALSIKMLWALPTISAKYPQAMTPTHK
ncbi:hypothetical protein D3C81_2197730 [compost metagenome]